MDHASVLALIEEGGIPYDQARPKIQPGDLLLLHHEYLKDWAELSWYDKQISLVQQFTGPFAHIGVLDRIQLADGSDQVICYESVVPRRRAVRVSTTAEHGFFWIPLHRPMTPVEREAIWRELGFGEYSKWGALLAGAGRLPADEDLRSRMWCAKFAAQCRRLSGVDLGPRYVPTDQALVATNSFNAQIRYVSMASGAPA